MFYIRTYHLGLKTLKTELNIRTILVQNINNIDYDIVQNVPDNIESF